MKQVVTFKGQAIYYIDEENDLFYSQQYPEGVTLNTVPTIKIGEPLEAHLRQNGLDWIVKSINPVALVEEVSVERLLTVGVFKIQLTPPNHQERGAR